MNTALPLANSVEPVAEAAGALHTRVRAFHERWRARWRFWAQPDGTHDAGAPHMRGELEARDIVSTTVCKDVGRMTVDLATQLRQPEQVLFVLYLYCHCGVW
jgi:hypothetical protein